MRVVLKGISIKTDGNKLNVDLKHEFKIPDTDVTVVCNYLKTGESQKYFEITKDGNFIIDYKKLFIDKVKEIKGLVLENEYDNDLQEFIITNPADLFSLPEMPLFDKIQNEVGTHLMLSNTLTDIEEKNLG